MDTPYGFTEVDFERVAEATRRVEGLPPRRPRDAMKRATTRAAPLQWVKTTSGSTSTINLVGGGTTTGYAAVWSYWDAVAGTWTDTANVTWLVAANFEPLTNLTRFLARCVGFDTNGVVIWMTEAQGPASTASFSGAQFTGLPGTTCPSGSATTLSQASGTTAYDTGSPAYGLTLKAPAAGYYAGVFTMVMTTGTTAFAGHVVTSTSQQLADSVTNAGAAGGSLNLSWQGHLAANDTVSLQVSQFSGGNTTCNIKSQSIFKIG